MLTLPKSVQLREFELQLARFQHPGTAPLSHFLVHAGHAVDSALHDFIPLPQQGTVLDSEFLHIPSIVTGPKEFRIWSSHHGADITIIAMDLSKISHLLLSSAVKLLQMASVSTHEQVFRVWRGHHGIDEALVHFAEVLGQDAVFHAPLLHVTVFVTGEEVVGVPSDGDREDAASVDVVESADDVAAGGGHLAAVALGASAEEGFAIWGDHDSQAGAWEHLAVVVGHNSVGDVDLLDLGDRHPRAVCRSLEK